MQYDPRKPKPWPIRLALKYGAKNDDQAQLFVMIAAVVLILISLYIYSSAFSSEPAEEIDPSILQEMEMMTAQ